MTSLPLINVPVKYGLQQAAFEDFLKTFKISASNTESAAASAMEQLDLDDSDLSSDYDMMDDVAPTSRNKKKDSAPKMKYMEILQDIANREKASIEIDLDDLDKYERGTLTGEDQLRLIDGIETNTKRYLEVFSRAVDALMPAPTKEITFKDDVVDILMSQRSRRNENVATAVEVEQDAAIQDSAFPAELTRRYTLSFKPRTQSAASGQTNKSLAVRDVKGEHLGHLIVVRGIATRVSDVKPAVLVNAYSCDRCGCEIFQPVATKQFTPLVDCPSKDCKENDARGQLFMSTRASKFVPFQEVKIQEMADQVPVGHIPRTLTIHCHGSLTRQINPGDVIDVAGIFLPTPYTGFRALKAGLLTDTYLEAQNVQKHKKAYEDLTIDPRTLRRIRQYKDSGHMYDSLARSIAPEIFGHLDVKKALLLLLIGGVTKEMGDGMRIRGDINICLMGDPGVAKSQLLKYITKVAPRGVYTTGRGSSGVGLTAAVMRDPVTDEMVLEGGALVLADNGICCIDEFDKMDEGDRTAIHEVMEQQTISISKAGISTTLNARTSILAAANPLYGRYNPKISPVENINLPAALLSRFDILFLILDTPSRETDEDLARHVTFVHMENRHPDPAEGGLIFTPNEVRQYVAEARTYRPTIPKAVADYLTGAYVRLRQQHARDLGTGGKVFAHVSPRTLLGVVRLAQALARLRFSNEVTTADVDEALRLTEVSKVSLHEPGSSDDDRSTASKIYHLVRGMATTAGAGRRSGAVGELAMRDIRERVRGKGFTDDQLASAIEEYAELDVWQTAGDGTRLVFIRTGEEDAQADSDEEREGSMELE